jgi:hypothetical protein
VLAVLLAMLQHGLGKTVLILCSLLTPQLAVAVVVAPQQLQGTASAKQVVLLVVVRPIWHLTTVALPIKVQVRL